MSGQQCQFVQIPVEILKDSNITPIELKLYCILMKFGFEGTGHSQAGHDYLSKLVGCHKQTIAKSLKRLQELGYIDVERVGLNRNDKIFCLKTVKNQKKTKSRSECKPVVKKPEPDSSPSISNNRTKEYRSIDQKSDVSKTDCSNDHSEQIQIHREDTENLLAAITERNNPTMTNLLRSSCVINSSEEEITLLMPDDFTKDYVEQHYVPLLKNIVGKEVNLFRGQ